MWGHLMPEISVKKLIFMLLTIGFFGVFLNSASAQTEADNLVEESDSKTEDREEMGKMTVTGSRIKRADIETATPVTVITSEDIEKQGHANVYEAIRVLTANTGGVLDEQETNSFTAAAQAVNLRGFGPGRTLVLLNGNRLPSNPKPYGGEDNFVNLALIPTTAVERVEYLSSGGSAIYGSDAIAGVINIILRDDYDGLKVTARYTDTQDGGGETHRLGIMGGKYGDGWSLNYGVEYDERMALFGRDRDWLDERTDSPAESPRIYNDRDILIAYPFGRGDLGNWAYQDPGEGACESHPDYEYSFRDPRGYYCGHDSTGDRALRAPRERKNAFFNAKYDINDDHSFFASALWWESVADAELFNAAWWEQVSVVGDINNPGDTWLYDVYYQRIFTNEEVPNEQHFEEDVLMLNFGFEGFVFDDYEYKLSFSWTDYDYEESIARFTRDAGFETFFGVSADHYYDPWGVYLMLPSEFGADGYTAANGLSMYDYFNNGEMDGIYGLSTAMGNSYARAVSYEMSGAIADLPAGDLMFAGVVEWNQQGYTLEVDPVTSAGGYIGWSGVSGGGERDHYALGAEFLIPVTETIEATVAGRYDLYDDASDVGGAPTFQGTLTWRPVSSFLMRAQYGTTFRAPDLHRLFANPSQYFNTVSDYYACLVEFGATQDNAPEAFNHCGTEADGFSVRHNVQGDTDLKEETGYSANIGFVWDITDNLDISVDVYRIRLDDTVNTLSANRYSELEAECRLGFDRNGGSIDSNSASCQELYSRIVRDGSSPGSSGDIDGISEVFVSSINTGLQEQTGLDARIHYGFATETMGRFDFGINHTNIFEIKYQLLPTDDVDEDVRDTSYYSFPVRNRSSFYSSWNYEDFSANVFVNRLGSTRNWSGDGRTTPYITTNLSTAYQFNEHWRVAFTVNNLFEKRPPENQRWENWPFYNTYAYPNGGVGREFYLTVEYEL